MPRVTITFTIPDEEPDMRAALAGREALVVLREIERWCRDRLKHGDPPPAERAAIIAIRDMIPQELLEI